MSNNDNIYNILNNFNKIAKDAPPAPAATSKAKTKLQESMEQVVNEKYMGFKKTVAAVKKGGSAEDPEAVAAAIGRKKYGKEKFQKAAAAGKKLNEKAVNPYAVGMAVAKKKAGITAKPAHDLPKKVIKKAHEIAKKIDEGTAEEMTPNWAKYVLDQLYNSDGEVTLTDLFDEGIPGLYDMFMDTAQKHGLNTDDEFEDVQHELTLELEDLIKGGHDLDEGFDDMIKDVNKKAKEKGTGKFDKKEISTGTVYTRKYNPKSGETDDTENVSAEKRGRGRPKKSAFEGTSTIDKMIAESFGELFEGTWRPVGDPVSKAAPAAPAVGSGIRVTPMPALATPAKPAAGQGSIQGGVWTATPPKAGTPGVPVPQGLDEGDPEIEDMRKMAGLSDPGIRAQGIAPESDSPDEPIESPYRVKISGYNKPGVGADMGMSGTGVTRDTPRPEAIGLDEVDAEMEDMRRMAGLKGGQKKLDRDQDGKLTAKDFSMLRKGLEEGGRDDMEEHIDKVQWLMGAPNYLSRDEAEETAYYNTDPTAPVWAGYYEDDLDEEALDPTMPSPEYDRIAAMQADPNFKPLRPGNVERSIERGAAMDKDAREQQKYKDRTSPGVINKIKDTFGVSKPNPAYAPKPAVPAPTTPVQNTNEDDMEEGNAFSGAVAKAKADGIQPGETINVDGKEYDLKEGDAALNQMRRIAGLKECGMSPISGAASDMQDEQGNMNISTNQNSDGTKSVTITAAGDAASSLMQMLKLAGMGGQSQEAEPQGVMVIARDSEEGPEQEMEEEKDPRYQASTTPDEQVAPVQALTKGGNGDVAGQEKKMKPGGYQFGDNNLAMQESLSAQLMKEYNSIKIKK